jgi:hypothetical protein
MNAEAEPPQRSERGDVDVTTLSAVAEVILRFVDFAERQSQVANELSVVVTAEPFGDECRTRRDDRRISSQNSSSSATPGLSISARTRVRSSSPNCQQMSSSSFRATAMRRLPSRMPAAVRHRGSSSITCRLSRGLANRCRNRNARRTARSQSLRTRRDAPIVSTYRAHLS